MLLFLWWRLNNEQPRLIAGAMMAGIVAKGAVPPIVVNALAWVSFHKAVSCPSPLSRPVAKSAQNGIYRIKVPVASANGAAVCSHQTAVFVGSRFVQAHFY